MNENDEFMTILGFRAKFLEMVISQKWPHLRFSGRWQTDCSNQGVKVRTLGRQNERNFAYDRLALATIFGLCFMLVCLIKSNCYSLIYSSLGIPYYQGRVQRFGGVLCNIVV